MLSMKSKPLPPIFGSAVTVIPETKPEAALAYGAWAASGQIERSTTAGSSRYMEGSEENSPVRSCRN